MAYKKRWGELFYVMDHDRNGVLGTKDIDALAKQLSAAANLPIDNPQIQGATGAYGRLLNNVIENFDEDKDGKATKDEFFPGVEKYFINKTPTTVPRWLRQCIEDFYPSYDTNRDGEISLQEIKVGLKAADPGQSDENIEKAYDWVKKHNPSGKYDLEGFCNMAYMWATATEDIPEITTLTPYFRKRVVIWGTLCIFLE